MKNTPTDSPALTRSQVIEHVLVQNLNQKLTTALCFGMSKEIDELLTKFAAVTALDQAKEQAAAQGDELVVPVARKRTAGKRG